MWVQLKSIQYIEVRGKMTQFHSGDWVDVGKQTAQLWLERGDAVVPNTLPAAINGAGAGALVLSGEEHARQMLKPYIGLDIQTGGQPELRWDKTVIWDAGACSNIIPGRFGAGLQLLDKWEIAVPLYDYKTLAANIGTEEEREETRKAILDLRVPLYDTRLMFVRRTPDTERLMSLWRMEPGERRLAFLRSLWKHKVFILALPASWSGHNVPG